MSNSKKSIKLSSPEAYNLWSKNYDQFDNPMLTMVRYAMETHPLKLSGMNAVELGCGTGRNIPTLLEAGVESYIGVDLSAGMLEKAQAKFPNLRFINTDIQKQLPFPDSHFDFVLVSLVFEHLENLITTLSEIHRILKDGGKLRILEIHSDLTTNGTQAHFQHEEHEIRIPSFPHSKDEFKNIMSQVGFEIVLLKELSPNSETIHRCSKLSKHQGKRVLIDIEATKQSKELKGHYE